MPLVPFEQMWIDVKIARGHLSPYFPYTCSICNMEHESKKPASDLLALKR